MSDTLFIGNLPFTISAAGLQELVSQTAPVKECRIPTDPRNGKIKGFAFLTLESPENARKVIEAFDGTKVEGRTINVMDARPPYLPPDHS